MGFFEKANEALSFALKQLSGFIEILRLKLRIIGFADKRSGLFTRLGEMTYMAAKNNSTPIENGKTASFVEEIQQTEREISGAEEAINANKLKSKSERDEFRTKWKMNRPEPAVTPQEGDEALSGGGSSSTRSAKNGSES